VQQSGLAADALPRRVLLVGSEHILISHSEDDGRVVHVAVEMLDARSNDDRLESSVEGVDESVQYGYTHCGNQNEAVVTLISLGCNTLKDYVRQ
jgi:hypothetical protein